MKSDSSKKEQGKKGEKARRMIFKDINQIFESRGSFCPITFTRVR